MTALTPQQENSLAAFITALAQQETALPPTLTNQLQAIGHSLGGRIVELPTIAASLPDLNQAYQAALVEERSEENEGATLVSNDSDDSARLYEKAVEIFTAADPVEAAQQNVSPSLGRIVSAPFKRLFGNG